MADIVVTDAIGIYLTIRVSVGEDIAIVDAQAISGLAIPAGPKPNVNDAVTATESVAGSLLTDGAYRQGQFAQTTQVTFPMSVRQRNTLAVFVRWAGPGPIANLTSVSDTNGNIYTLVANPTQSGSGYRVAAAVATNAAADGALTIIANFDVPPSLCLMAAHEVTQRDLLAPIDGSSSSTQDFPIGTDGVSSGNFVTSRDGAYIFGGSSEAGSGVPTHAGTGFLMRHRDQPAQAGFITEDTLQTTAGTTAATFSPDPAGFAYATIGLALQFARAWLPEIAESVSVAESSSVAIPLMPVISEDIAVSESISVLEFPGRLQASDDVAVTDPATVSISSFPGLTINVFDVVILEAVAPPAPSLVELISVTELVVIAIRGVAAAETVTIAENITVRLTVRINVFDEIKLVIMAESWDTVTVSESVSLTFGTFGARQINVFELVTVTEARAHAFNPLQASANDAVAATEVVSARPSPLRVSASDDVALTDQPTAALLASIGATAFDAVTVTENVLLTLQTAGQLVIAVSDTLTITESATIFTAPNATVFDAVTIAENVTIAVAQLKASVNDAITITDVASLSVSELGGVAVSDSLTVDEAVSLALSNIQLVVFENVSVGEGRELEENPLQFEVAELVGVEDAPLTLVGDRQPVPRYRGMFPWERWIRRNE